MTKFGNYSKKLGAPVPALVAYTAIKIEFDMFTHYCIGLSTVSICLYLVFVVAVAVFFMVNPDTDQYECHFRRCHPSPYTHAICGRHFNFGLKIQYMVSAVFMQVTVRRFCMRLSKCRSHIQVSSYSRIT